MRTRVTSKRKTRRPAPAKRKGLTLRQMMQIVTDQPPRARRKAPKRRKITLADLVRMWR